MMYKTSKLDTNALAVNKNIVDRSYWKKRLESFEATNYFYDFDLRKSLKNKAVATTTKNAAKRIYTQLDKIAGAAKSKHVVLLSALGILIQKSYSINDLAIFTPVYADNKDSAQQNKIIPVRMDDFSSLPFRKFLGELAANLSEDIKHGNYPLNKIIEDNNQLKSSLGLLVEEIHQDDAFADLDTSLLFSFTTTKGLSLTVTYDANLFSENFINRTIDLFFDLLEKLMLKNELPAKHIELISGAEKSKILDVFNNTEKAFPRDKTLLDFFNEQVIKNPQAPAIKFRAEQLTYKELDEKSNQVANYLSKNTKGKGSVIGVYLDRSNELIVAIFGILKAGFVYLPLSKNYPVKRTTFTLENSKAELVFVEANDAGKLSGTFNEVSVASALSNTSTTAINLAKPEDLAYIIYTSGSTGNPKGVLIKHGSIVNRLNWMQNQYPLNSKDTILQKTPIVFDVSVWELFWWSMFGAKLVLAEPNAEKEPRQICETIDKENISILHFVPSMLRAMVWYLKEYNQGHSLKNIRQLFTSGEALKTEEAQSFLSLCPKARLLNLYGPTEATVDVSYYEVTSGTDQHNIPIGKPIDNTSLFIFNKDQQLQPIGLPGELHIGGVNLSLGYLNQKELTDSKFIQSPLNENERLYKTGDLARWLPDGNIEFLGRIDNQVKIRGNRIELGEIELAINAFDGIENAVVLTKELNGGLQLVGYLVKNTDCTEADLSAFLAEKLPDYMIPSYFIDIDEVPLTVNGKVDRKALLALKQKVVSTFVPTTTSLEKTIEKLWAKVLKVKQVSAVDSFFRIGGDSILALRLMAMINAELDQNLSVIDLYSHDTIQQLAAEVEGLESSNLSEEYELIEEELRQTSANYLAGRKDVKQIHMVYPMSDIEKAMCYADLARPEDILYFEQILQPVFYERFKLGTFQKALDLLVQKHETLRTGFDLNEFMHIIYKKVDTEVKFHDLSQFDQKEQQRIMLSDLEKGRALQFDISIAPLWRIALYKLSATHHEILFEQHHAILDGWSFASFLTELNNTYGRLLKNKAAKPEALECSYKDLIVQELYLKKSEEAKNYWINELKDYKKLALHVHADTKYFRSFRKLYPKDLYSRLAETAKAQNVTLKTILHTAYIYAMKMISGQNDILTGLVTFSRPLKKDGEKLLGCFLNTIPFRVQVEEEISWTDFIQMIRNKSLEVKKYEQLSLFEINQAVGARSQDVNPLFDTHFNYVNWHVTKDIKYQKLVESDTERLDFDVFLRGNTFFDANYNVSENNVFSMHEYSAPFMTEEIYDIYENIFLHALSKIIDAPQDRIDPPSFFWEQEIIKLKTDLTKYATAPQENQITPASFKQKVMWADAFLSGDDTNKVNTYGIIPLIVNIEIQPDLKRLGSSIQEVMRRHNILRAQITNVDGQLSQNVLEEFNFELELEVVNNSAYESLMERLSQPFGFDQSLFRARLLQFETGEYKLVIVFHASIVDQFSINKIFNEIVAQYAKGSNKNNDSEKQAVQYADYTLWQENALSILKPYHTAFWDKQLSPEFIPLELPTNKTNIEHHYYAVDTVDVNISSELFNQIASYEKENGVSAKIILMAVFKVLLSKYAQQENIVIGALAENRQDENLNQLVGPLTNSIAIATNVDPSISFNAYVDRLNTVFTQSIKHGVFPQEILSGVGHSAEELFNVLFQYQEESSQSKMGDWQLVETNFGLGKHEVNLSLKKHKDEFTGKIFFNESYFDTTTIEVMLAHYKELIKKLLAAPKQQLAQMNLVSAQEEKQLLSTFNDTLVAYKNEETAIALIETKAQQTPDATAIICENESLSYEALDRKSNQLANHLLTKGVSVGDLIPICVDRSLEMMIGILGILKAGAAYIPIDPSYPIDRLSYMLVDSKAKFLLTTPEIYTIFKSNAVDEIIYFDDCLTASEDNPKVKVGANSAAYVIYTSGTTGNPKGVIITHQNLTNFFVGLNEKFKATDHQETWLAITSISFDISILELLWTLSNGNKVIIQPDKPVPVQQFSDVDFGLFYFAAQEEIVGGDKYELLLEGAKIGDANGFNSVWVPERHFHSFGDQFPNPSVAAAAVAVLTKQVKIRSGSVVLPLHDSVRVAEEWSMVDNLSKGRVELSIATGWNPNDFVLETGGDFKNRHVTVREQIKELKLLWEGGSLTRENGIGNEVSFKIHPKPIQPHIPIWITAAGNIKTFEYAGEIGANLLTHLLGQTVEELAEKIAHYRATRKANGFDPDEGKVAIMLHTFVSDDENYVKSVVEQPFKNYLRQSINLMKPMAEQAGLDIENDVEKIVEIGFQRYFKTSGLFGTPASCLQFVEELSRGGVNEIACLVDFGIETKTCLDNFSHLTILKDLVKQKKAQSDYLAKRLDRKWSIAASMKKHDVTHLQSTPSFILQLLVDQEGKNALNQLEALLLGGEALPDSLTTQLFEHLQCPIHNMYGPTETTIWSSIQTIHPDEKVNIGKPIANTQIYVLDKDNQLCPINTTGEICIGGDGVAQGYLHRKALTDEKFIDNPFIKNKKIYRTGDIGKWLPNGELCCLGRVDDQVKINGHRIEPSEIEAILESAQGVEKVVVAAKGKGSGDKFLVAYLVGEKEMDISTIKAGLKSRLPEYMVPKRFVILEDIPLTPNGKIDRKALPIPEAMIETNYKAPANETEESLTEIWANVLDLDQENISTDSSFFELGGNSLKILNLKQKIYEKFNLKIDAVEFFRKNTVEEFSKFIENEAWLASTDVDEVASAMEEEFIID